MKREVFRPTFLTFPFLDRLGFPSRRRARNLVTTFTDELCRILLDSCTGLECISSTESLGSRMVAARDSGVLTEQQFRHNMVSIFLAGHENPQLLLISLVYLLGKYPVCGPSESTSLSLTMRMLQRRSLIDAVRKLKSGCERKFCAPARDY